VRAFPASLKDEVQQLLQSSKDMKIWSEPTGVMVGDEEIGIPYRVWADTFDVSDLSIAQRTIYHCLFSRSTDGYIREASVRELLKLSITDWAVPYLFLALSDYVIQVANVVASEAKLKEPLTKFASQNRSLYNLSTARAISFWDLNRHEGIRYENYHDSPPYKMLKSLNI
jgi:hypothetical protein